jgi:hypothetical protein
MRKIILLICMFVCQVAYSQSAYIKQYITDKYEVPMCILQMSDINFITLLNSNEMFGYERNSKLLKTNSAGATEAEYSFGISDSSYYYITSILPVSESEFITVAPCKQYELPYAQIGVAKFDTSLQLVWEKKFILNQPSTSNLFTTKNSIGNIIIGLALNTGDPLWEFSLLFMEITTNGDSIWKSRNK